MPIMYLRADVKKMVDYINLDIRRIGDIQLGALSLTSWEWMKSQ